MPDSFIAGQIQYKKSADASADFLCARQNTSVFCDKRRLFRKKETAR
jgi:hypothetical protein